MNHPPFVTSSLLQKIPFLTHGFSTRVWGSDTQKIASHFNFQHDAIYTLKQIHSNRTLVIDETTKPTQEIVEGDALVTKEQGVLLGIRTADCVPLLVVDQKNGLIAAIHAGWRGLVEGVIEEALNKLGQAGGQSSHYLVAIGPSLCGNCFEVGDEVAKIFDQKFKGKLPPLKTKLNKSYFDLKDGCRLILESNYVLPSHIDRLPFCTMCDHDLFYSYRKGDQKMRLMSFVGLA